MLHIPTLFLRDPEDRRFVTDQVMPGCEWVLAGEGTATRLYDGVGVLFDPAAPHIEHSPVPDLQGWFVQEGGELVPAWRAATLMKAMLAAVRNLPASNPPAPGTHELIGPAINRNAERVREHQLIAHRDAAVLDDAPRDHAGLSRWLLDSPYAGIVWHHPDGRMAKLKRKDVRRG